MAKTSAVLRDEKRRKMYEKYAAKRAELKAAGDIEGLQKLTPAQPASRTAICLMAAHAVTCVASASAVLTSAKKQARAKSLV